MYVIWLTGLPCSGKSTLAGQLCVDIERKGRRVVVLDGDQLRKDLNSDLGFTAEDRKESVRRAAAVANLLIDKSMVAIVAMVSPYGVDRARAAEMIGHNRFIEVFVDTPVTVCTERDSRGMYAMAEKGEIKNFTGVSDPYEPPDFPDVHILPGATTLMHAIHVWKHIVKRGLDEDEVVEPVPSDEDNEPIEDPDPDFDYATMKPKEPALEGGTPDPSPNSEVQPVGNEGAKKPEPEPEPEKLPPPKQRRVYPTTKKRCNSCGHTEVVAVNRKICPECKTGRLKPIPASERPRPDSTAVRRKPAASPPPKTGNGKTAKKYRGGAEPEAACANYTKPGPGRMKKKCVCGKIVYVMESITACPYCDRGKGLSVAWG
jgi:adenylyl-sulfate kinase